MHIEADSSRCIGHAFVCGNEFGGLKLEGGGDVDAVQGAKEEGRIVLECCAGGFGGPDFDILSEWSKKEATFAEVTLEFRENPDGGICRDFALGLFGVKGKSHFVFENNAAGKRLLFF
jgi:hypothetical protein